MQHSLELVAKFTKFSAGLRLEQFKAVACDRFKLSKRNVKDENPFMAYRGIRLYQIQDRNTHQRYAMTLVPLIWQATAWNSSVFLQRF